MEIKRVAMEPDLGGQEKDGNEVTWRPAHDPSQWSLTLEVRKSGEPYIVDGVSYESQWSLTLEVRKSQSRAVGVGSKCSSRNGA